MSIISTISLIFSESNENDIISIPSDDGCDDDTNISITSIPEHECICHLKLEDVDFLTCTNCKKVHHSVCHGFLEVEESVKKQFRCNICGESDTKIQNFPDLLKDNIAKIR